MLCPDCGIWCGETSRFCSNCGTKLPQNALAAASGAAFMDRPTNWSKSDILFSERHQAEKKIVSILFADIVGSTRIIASLEPEKSIQLLDSIISVFEREVRFFGGIVSRVMGDGIFALFGVAHVDEHHARDACLAALRIQRAIKTSPDHWLTEELGAVNVRIGVSTGETIVRSQKHDSSVDHLATGLCVHLGARLQQRADAGSIFCDETTYALSKPENFTWQTRGKIGFRGFADTVEVYELQGVAGSQAALAAMPSSTALAFMGRDAELKKGQNFLHAIHSGSARAIHVSGPPGIGKTRFCAELIKSNTPDRREVLWVECTSYGQHTPFAPFALLIRNHLSNLGIRGDADVLRAVGDITCPILPEARDVRFGIQTVLGLEVSDPEWRALDPLRRRTLVFEAMSRTISFISRNETTFVVENVHWLDDESQQLLEHVLETCGDQVLFILTSRQSGSGTKGDTTSRLHIRLDELAADDALELIGHCLGGQSSPALAHTIHLRTGGNPFFIIEFVKELRDRGAHPERDGRGDPVADGLDRLPVTLRSLLSARLDVRKPAEKRLIQLCSVSGGELAKEVVESCCVDMTASELASVVARLTEEGYLTENFRNGKKFYYLSVNLLQEVVIKSLLSSQKRRLHLMILRGLEKVYGAAISSYVEISAYHAKMSGSAEEAIRYSWEAGRRAIDRSAYLVATRFLEDALDFCLKQPRDSQQAAAAIDICFDLRRAYFPIGNIPKDLENLEFLENNLADHADLERRARLAAYVARDLAQLGRPDQSLPACERALALARDAGVRKLELLTEGYIGAAHYALGNYATSLSLLRNASTGIAEIGPEETLGLPASAHLFFEAWKLWAISRLGDSATEATAAIVEFGQSHDQPLTLAVALYSAGFYELHHDQFDRACMLLSEGLAICEEHKLLAWYTNLSMSLGYAELGAGRPQSAREHLQGAVDRSRALGIMVSHSLEVAWLAEAQLACGDGDEALKSANEALALADRYRECGNRGEALYVLGLIQARQDGVSGKESLATLKSAAALARRCGMAPLLRKCRAATFDPGRLATRELREAAGET